MTWFRVDDSFGDHPKVRAIPRGKRRAAVGLWTLTGAWSARHLTDGFVPRAVALEEGSPAEVADLLAAGLWLEVEGGYQFNDWDVYQPTRAQVQERRRVRAEAGAKGGTVSGRVRRLRAIGEDES